LFTSIPQSKFQETYVAEKFCDPIREAMGSNLDSKSASYIDIFVVPSQYHRFSFSEYAALRLCTYNKDAYGWNLGLGGSPRFCVILANASSPMLYKVRGVILEAPDTY
jgi:hypothetical protein